MKKPLKIAQIGTFEVKNYGDNLFPLILNHELSRRIKRTKIDFWGPYGGHINYKNFNFLIKGLIKTNHYSLLVNYDVIIIGGGDLIRFDEKVVNEHYKSQIGIKYSNNFKPIKSMLIYKPGLWLRKRPIIIWNAVGVLGGNAKKCKRLTDSVDLLAVRGNCSKQKLLDCGVKKEISIVPDTALLIKEILEKIDLLKYGKGSMLNKSDVNKKRTLGFQCGKWFLSEGMTQKILAKKLLNFSKKYDINIVLIPIGYCHGDLDILKQLNILSNNSFILINDSIDTIDTALLISQCDYVVASSLHANITASSFNIPHLGINTLKWRKTTDFFEIINRKDLCLEDWENFDEKLTVLIQEAYYKSTSEVKKAKNTISNHFDRVAKLIEHLEG